MNAAHAADLAYAASGPPGAGGSSALVTQVLFFAAIFAIFYFLLIRPQQKQKRDREQMLSAIKKGDRIVTTGGLHGTDRKSTRLNSSHTVISYAVFCLKKKKTH